MKIDDEVLFEEVTGKGGHIGVITLNRPEILNCINQSMVQAMHKQLQSWASVNTIKAVVIRAVAGRAFCAGGDLRFNYDRWLANDPALAHFFRDEYQLNRFIFHFPKPYIAFLDGITMGGGVGISIHGSHRIATDRFLFAMPETGIGFFPDVGGTYFLPRLPGRIGFYLGLTGARIKIDDSVALGITQQKVSHEALPEILVALSQQRFGDNAKETVTQVINEFKKPIQNASIIEQQKLIDECFIADTMEEILERLEKFDSKIAKETIAQLNTKSPTSLKITLKALQEGMQLDFDACMRQEFRLTCRFLQGHDFTEGIRAVIIDKDQMPKWKPNSLAAVSDDEVTQYFSPLPEELKEREIRSKSNC